jgi:hypothetical protein
MRFHADLPKSLMDSSFAPRWATVRPIEKVAHSLIEITQSLLLHSLRTRSQPVVFGAGSSQLHALLVVTGRVSSWLPMLLLLDGQVPHIPGVATMLMQHSCLLGGRKQPISRHASNVTATTDKPPKAKQSNPPG